MENFLKTLYFDWKLFQVLSFSRWIQITCSKYRSLVLLLFGVKSVVFRAGKNRIAVSTVADLGSTVSSLSDEYWDLIKIIRTDLRTVIDVGANIGQFTNAIKFWCPNATIRAFEPDPDTYKVLVNNARFSDVRTYNLALADSKGNMQFYKAARSGLSSLVKVSDAQTHIQVKTDTADAVLADVPKIDLLKIDVEGAELRVLRGAHESLKKTKHLLVEMSFDRGTDGASNMDILAEVRAVCPRAVILHIGRALNNEAKISAQDFLIQLQP